MTTRPAGEGSAGSSNAAAPGDAKAGNRLAYLDWTRGLAAVTMLQGHVFHSFTDVKLKETYPYLMTQFLGGMPPAMFLFLTGVTLAFMLNGQERRGALGWGRVWAAMKRARYMLIMAFAFRIQLWLSAWPQHWSAIFRVDILNCMGLAIIACSWLALLSTLQRAWAGAAAGLLIATASPMVSGVDWGGLHPFIVQYLKPDYNFFAFFPWASYLAFGVAAGSVIRLVPSGGVPRMMQWFAITGSGLILAGEFFSDLPYSILPNSQFWLNSPNLIFIKLGLTLIVVSFAHLWMTHRNPEGRWSFLTQLGTTSLLVYWAHIELVYGRWFGIFRDTLSLELTAVIAVVVIGLMVALSVGRTNWRAIRQRFAVQPANRL
ncbi:MAG: acyltransferase [Acidobacteria bacterium]|nr:acyltransferase [Acidobacteriota bacterium]